MSPKRAFSVGFRVNPKLRIFSRVIAYQEAQVTLSLTYLFRIVKYCTVITRYLEVI